MAFLDILRNINNRIQSINVSNSVVPQTIELEQIPNVSSTNKAISSAAVYIGLLTKQDKIEGKVLSSNDFTTNEKNKIVELSTTVINLQTDIDSKQPLGNYATTSDLTSGLTTKANTSHIHSISDITSLQTLLDSKAGAWDGTQSQYDAIPTKDNSITYYIHA